MCTLVPVRGGDQQHRFVANLQYRFMPRTGTKEAVSACGQAMAPPSQFSAGSYHEPVLMRLWQAVFSPTSTRERDQERFISPECRDDEEEAQCSRCLASSLQEYGRLHGAMRSAVYTIPKGLKQINEHCTSFLFLITYYNSGLLLLWQKLIARRHFFFLSYNSRL